MVNYYSCFVPEYWTTPNYAASLLIASHTLPLQLIMVVWKLLAVTYCIVCLIRILVIEQWWTIKFFKANSNTKMPSVRLFIDHLRYQFRVKYNLLTESCWNSTAYQISKSFQWKIKKEFKKNCFFKFLHLPTIVPHLLGKCGTNDKQEYHLK